MHNKIIDTIKNYKNIAIVGYGREGKSTYNFIRKYLKDIKLTIIDIRNVYEENNELKSDSNLNIVYGENYLDNLDVYDLIFKTPGISFKNIKDISIRNKIVSQIGLLLEVNSQNMIGITGTKGKSTTSTLIYNILKDQGIKTFLVGNIGIPVFELIEKYDDDTIIVTEMSSDQLEFVHKSPHIGIILNLYQDHLDHAGTLENYHNSKMNIIRYQDGDDYAICDIDNEYLQKKLSEVIVKSNLLGVSFMKDTKIYLKDTDIYLNNKFLINSKDIERNILGNHNLKNIMFVLLLCDILKLDLSKTFKTIKKFKGLEHRMEYVGTFKEIKFYNDTISTIPEATINNCEALKEVDTLIIGGLDRNIDYTKLVDYIKKSNIRNIICMPSTGYKLSDLIKNDYNNVYKAETLDNAVEIAYQVTFKNKICLLSPAAPSYEYFKNFEEKGKKYKELIYEYSKK